ncbi:glycoside hydrolase domain-containing protein [Olivibacter sitiensis]|uniref:glycoside hydrolase domain-containing protein n=1 Tax=Olivibacter sitiensis TaxID=376470 RepID=UPI000484DB8D|nr:glycoside hydrolase domain-containing protein [Olivibacter sitiensis]
MHHAISTVSVSRKQPPSVHAVHTGGGIGVEPLVAGFAITRPDLEIIEPSVFHERFLGKSPAGVMAGIGLFDVKGLTAIDPKFQIGSPIFDKIEIELNKDYYRGGKFTIEVENNSTENIYVQSISKNGKERSSVFMPFEDIVNGEILKIKMGNEPNLNLKN